MSPRNKEIAPETTTLVETKPRKVEVGRIIAKIGMATVFGLMIGKSLATMHDFLTHPDVNIAALPRTLPKAVAEQIQSAIKVESLVNPKSDEISIGSGVQINPYEYITAGHVITTHRNPIKLLSTCGNEPMIEKQNGSQENASSGFGYFDQINPAETDIGILRTFDANNSISTFPKISNKGVFPGEQVYFVNYEPTSTGYSRFPDIMKGINPYSHPAIYGGVVLNNNGGNYEIATGLKSYGAEKDLSSRPGASGGAVFDSSGYLIGEITRATSGINSSAEIANEAEVSLTGSSKNSVNEESIVQPITKALVVSLENKLNNLYHC
jgi:hypothetical protein